MRNAIQGNDLKQDGEFKLGEEIRKDGIFNMSRKDGIFNMSRAWDESHARDMLNIPQFTYFFSELSKYDLCLPRVSQ